MKIDRFGHIVSSWWLTGVLFLAICSIYLFFTFGQDPYARWAHFLFRSPAGLALYFCLIVNLVAASFRLVLRSLALKPLSAEVLETMDIRAEMPGRRRPQEIAAWMKSKGFAVTIRGNSMYASKNKFSFLPGTVIRSGFIILLVSLLVSIYSRETRTAVLHEGQETDFFSTKITATGIEATLPSDFLQVGEESSFQLEHAIARLSFSGRTFLAGPGFPTRINGNYYRLTNVGYAQPVLIKSGRVQSRLDMDLDILPPGKTQIVTIPDGNIFFTVSLEPDRTISKGLLKGRQFNLGKPFYRIAVLKNGENKSKPRVLTLRQGESGTAGNVKLSLGKSALYARIQAVRDPALAWIYLGFSVTLIGLALMLTRFFWYQKEMIAVDTGSMLTIGYCEEFFKKWGIQKFYAWKDELLQMDAEKEHAH